MHGWAGEGDSNDCIKTRRTCAEIQCLYGSYSYMKCHITCGDDKVGGNKIMRIISSNTMTIAASDGKVQVRTFGTFNIFT